MVATRRSLKRAVDDDSGGEQDDLQLQKNSPARRAHDRRVQALPGSLVRELYDFPVALGLRSLSTVRFRECK